MNLADPELELIDPTPNVHTLFIHFDKLFFSTKLASRAVVRWSKKMYSCAGVCSYEGRGGLCDIALSEPLLKLRPRKDLIETLLHEMIHAYLFVTCRDLDRDGHGPNFQFHMHRINKFAGLNISIYHNFHDEVELYLTHWWRCNGPCQKRRPHFGIIRRSANRAPGPSEYWWMDHKRKCGGTFVKIKEPQNYIKKGARVKPNADITKYLNNNNNVITNNNVPTKTKKTNPVLKDSKSIPAKSNTKSNSSSTVIINKEISNSPRINSPIIKPTIPYAGKGQVISVGKGQTINGIRGRSNSVGVVETVRNIWANKQLSTTINNKANVPQPTVLNKNNAISNTNNVPNRNKHKALSVHADTPPTKVKKIDDYFKNAATVLKDLYGQDFNVTQSSTDQKLVAVPVKVNQITKSNLVDCPVCSAKIVSHEVNRHLDECLNKEVIETLCKDSEVNNINKPVVPSQIVNKTNVKGIIGDIPPIPAFKVKPENSSYAIKEENEKANNFTPKSTIDLTNIDHVLNTAIIKTENPVTDNSIPMFDSNDVNRVKELVKKIKYDKHIRKSDNFIVPKEEKQDNVNFGFLPSFIDDMACKIETPPIKNDPGNSKDIKTEQSSLKCACCGNEVDKPINEHLEECLAFFVNNKMIPEEGASTSFANDTIIIDDDDDDLFDESLILNATGTKSPCPCCLQMVEQVDMNEHLDKCLR